MTVSKLALPSPKNDDGKRRFINVKVSTELYDMARAEMKRRGVTVAQVLDWGLLAYLVETNPEAAKKLGVEP